MDTDDWDEDEEDAESKRIEHEAEISEDDFFKETEATRNKADEAHDKAEYMRENHPDFNEFNQEQVSGWNANIGLENQECSECGTDLPQHSLEVSDVSEDDVFHCSCSEEYKWCSSCNLYFLANSEFCPEDH